MIDVLVALVLWIMSLYMNGDYAVLGPATTVTREDVAEVEGVNNDPLVCWLPAVELTAAGGHPTPYLTDDFVGDWVQVRPGEDGPIIVGLDQFEPPATEPRCDI